MGINAAAHATVRGMSFYMADPRQQAAQYRLAKRWARRLDLYSLPHTLTGILAYDMIERGLWPS